MKNKTQKLQEEIEKLKKGCGNRRSLYLEDDILLMKSLKVKDLICGRRWSRTEIRCPECNQKEVLLKARLEERQEATREIFDDVEKFLQELNQKHKGK